MKFCLLLAVVMLSFGEALAEDGLAHGNDFVRLGYNNPAAIVDLKAGFYQLVYRLVATGQKVATVARSVNAHGKVSYRLSEKFGEGGTPA